MPDGEIEGVSQTTLWNGHITYFVRWPDGSTTAVEMGENEDGVWEKCFESPLINYVRDESGGIDAD